MFTQDISFSLIEWLALTGFAQGVLVLVYISFRLRQLRQAAPGMAYFLLLTVSFGCQFALRLEDYAADIRMALWFCQAMGPALCYLLVLQVANGLPAGRHYFVLVMIPLSFLLAVLFQGRSDAHAFFEWLYWISSMAGALILLALWAQRGLFTRLWSQKNSKDTGREKYWLVLTLIAANTGVVIVNLLRSMDYIRADNADALLVILGITFIYLAITTLFRVYPPPVELATAPLGERTELNAEERLLAIKARDLLEIEKLYHEPNFSRADLARELNCAESIVSRIIKAEFGKSLPRLISEYRVEDAKRLLKDKSIPVQTAAFEVGFNSLASFNRVFKEVTGQTPTGFRDAS